MKKLLYLIFICFLLGLTGCTSKKEEAIAVITEIPCETAGISFSLNGLWVIQEETETKTIAKEGQTIALSAYKEESGSGIQVVYEDLTKTDGGTLIRMDDYVTGIQEQLKVSEEYKYSCSEISVEKLHGNVYETFSAFSSELGGKQQYYIRRQDDTMIIMVITVFGEDNLEDILSLMSPV